MKRQTRAAFYVETLLLVSALVAVVLILAKCFSTAEQTRLRAGELTGAVHLTRNAAEAAAGAEAAEELAKMLSEDAPAVPTESGFRLYYDEDFRADPAGSLCLEISWDRRPQAGCGLVSYTIAVAHTDRDEEVYRLETAVYLGEETP